MDHDELVEKDRGFVLSIKRNKMNPPEDCYFKSLSKRKSVKRVSIGKAHSRRRDRRTSKEQKIDGSKINSTKRLRKERKKTKRGGQGKGGGSFLPQGIYSGRYFRSVKTAMVTRMMGAALEQQFSCAKHVGTDHLVPLPWLYHATRPIMILLNADIDSGWHVI